MLTLRPFLALCIS
uniref:ILV5 n=1 Tax=Arundo donax TaxID=35708 RepID=A0A0A9DVN5_ARUDO